MKKIFTFIAAAALTLSASAEVIYSWESNGPDAVTEVGGKATAKVDEARVNYANTAKGTTYYTICLSGKKGTYPESAYVNVALDQPLAAGDEISITAFRNKNESGKNVTAEILFSDGVSVATTEQFPNINADGENDDAPGTQTLVVPADAAGCTSFDMTRGSASTNLFITKLVITRAGGDTPAPSEDVANVKFFSFTVAPEAVGKTTYFQISANDGQKVQVDWGNGEKSEPVALADYDAAGWVFTQVAGEIKGTTITVYGEKMENINYLDLGYAAANGPETKILSVDVKEFTAPLKEFTVTSNNLSTLDLSANTGFVTVNAGMNALTSIVLPANSAIKTIDVSNTDATGEKGTNRVAATDWSVLTNLTTLKMNYNATETEIDLDLSVLADLTTVNANGCNIRSIDVSKNAKLKTLNLNDNKLTTLDFAAMPAKSIVFANNNQLTSIKATTGMTRLQVKDNKLDFTTLPLQESLGIAAATNYVYAPQQDMEVEVKNGVVDLASQAKVGDVATVYSWVIAEEGKELEAIEQGFTAEGGVFTFTKSVANAVCCMTNEALPSLTLKTVPMNIVVESSAISEIEADNAPVEYFNLQGIKVSGDQPGLYIRRQGGKTSKVIVK